MRRREFVIVVGGTVLLGPVASFAQQPSKQPTIGYLGGAESVESDWLAAFVRRFGELGWVEGRTVTIEVRWSGGRPERVAEIATEFVRQKLDVILSYGGAVTTLKKATTSTQQADTAGKRLELLRQIVPNLRRLAIVFDAVYSAAVLEMDAVHALALKLGLTVSPKGIKRGEEIPSVLAALKGQADALYVIENSLVAANGSRIAALALDMLLPTTFSSVEFARTGALMSYGPNVPALYQRAADYVDKILRGAKPGELPVEQPNKFDFVINLNTAKVLGIDVPYSMQLLADEVIE
jgi:putative tryptophan/tyrosine transport system substrate-binding protein